MSSTLQELQSLVIKGLGGRDDATAISVINASLNYATTLAALIFDPPELKEQKNLVITGGNNFASLDPLTDLLDIQTVYNLTDNNKMWYIPWESWDVILPSVVGRVKYYTVFGESLYVKDTPTVNKTLRVSYSTYPSKLVDLNDKLDFDYHDSYIVSVALGICWAFFEEGDSAATMERVANATAMPLAIGAKARQVIEGQRVSLESLLAQLRGEE